MSRWNFGWRVLSVFLSILDPQVLLSILLNHGFQQFNLSPTFGMCCPSSTYSPRREAGVGGVSQGVEMIGSWPWLIRSVPKTGVAEGSAETAFVYLGLIQRYRVTPPTPKAIFFFWSKHHVPKFLQCLFVWAILHPLSSSLAFQLWNQPSDVANSPHIILSLRLSSLSRWHPWGQSRSTFPKAGVSRCFP